METTRSTESSTSKFYQKPIYFCQQRNQFSSTLSLFRTDFPFVILYLVTDGEDEATGDDHTLFSEVQLTSDTEKSIFHLSKLDPDARLTRLRRSNIDDQRMSSAASLSSRSVNNEDKVNLNDDDDQ